MSLFMGRYLILLEIYSFYHVLIQASKTMAHFEFRPDSPAMTWHGFLLVGHTTLLSTDEFGGECDKKDT